MSVKKTLELVNQIQNLRNFLDASRPYPDGWTNEERAKVERQIQIRERKLQDLLNNEGS